MKEFFTKTILVLFFVFSILGFPKKSEAFLDDALSATGIAQAIWEVLREVVETASEEVIGAADEMVAEEGLDELSAKERLQEILDQGLADLDSEAVTTEFRDEFLLDENGDPILDENGNPISIDDAIGGIIDGILDDLEDRGAFNIDVFPYTRNEFGNVLTNFYGDVIFGDIEESVFGPGAGGGVLNIGGLNTNNTSGSSNNQFIEINMDPLYPKPGEIVTITLKDFSGNENNSLIEWSQNGQTLLSGLGENVLRDHQINQEGVPETIRIYIRRDDGSILSIDFEITPSEIDMIYEAYTYTPPFYKGKADLTSESLIKIIAVPHIRNGFGSRIDGNNLVYKWRINRDVISEYSGRGNNYMYLDIPFTEQDIDVSVEVSAVDDSFQTLETLNLRTGEPEIAVYQDHPTLGIVYEREMKDRVTMNDLTELTLKAVPYFMSINSRLNYDWLMNGEFINQNNSNEITLREEGGDYGVASISLDVTNTEKQLQSGSKLFDIIFND